MIHIEKNQAVPENDNLRVFSATGDYNDEDLIDCYNIENPNLPVSAFTAAFIKYGGFVYRFSNPETLGEALFKFDPNSNHDAATLYKEEKIRKMKRERGDFRPDKPVGAKDGGRARSTPEPASLITQTENSKSESDKILDTLLEESNKQEQIFSEPIPETVPVEISVPTTTPLDGEVVSSTPLQVPDQVIEPIPVPEMLTTTPAVTATSTEPVSNLEAIVNEVAQQTQNVSSTQN